MLHWRHRSLRWAGWWREGEHSWNHCYDFTSCRYQWVLNDKFNYSLQSSQAPTRCSCYMAPFILQNDTTCIKLDVVYHHGSLAVLTWLMFDMLINAFECFGWPRVHTFHILRYVPLTDVRHVPLAKRCWFMDASPLKPTDDYRSGQQLKQLKQLLQRGGDTGDHKNKLLLSIMLLSSWDD